MGFCVLHYDKQTGSSPGLSQHIERGCYRDGEWVDWYPTNADAGRTHLNRELISGELSRNERINKRIKDAGIKKPRKDQVTALTLIMSASCEDMQRIMNEGKFDDWCRSSIKWTQDTHGKENVVSAVLHMDEKTPHLHVTVVPIVQGMSKDQVYREKKAKEAEKKGIEQKKKRKYKKKDPDALRLCAADVMARTKLKEYQTTYANIVSEYGLERGIDGSIARHIDINDWYKELMSEIRNRQNEIKQLDEETKLKKTEAETNLNDIKNKVVNLSKENERLTTETKEKTDIISSLKSQIEHMDLELADKTERRERLKGAFEGTRQGFSDLFTGNARKSKEKAEKRATEAEEKCDRIISIANQKIHEAYQKVTNAEAMLAEETTKRIKAEEEAAQANRRTISQLKDLAEIDNIRLRLKDMEKEHIDMVEFLQDAENFNLSAFQIRQLYTNKSTEATSLTDPESGHALSRSDEKKIRLKLDRGRILAYLSTSWERAKEWFKSALNSPWFSIDGIPNDRRRRRGFKY